MVAERALHVAIPLDGVRRAVGRIHRERRRELRDVVQIGEERVDLHAEVRPRRLQRKLTVERRHQPRELQLVQIEVVVIHAESAPDDGVVVHRVRGADSRSPVVQIFLEDAGREEPVLIDDQRDELRRQVRRHDVEGNLARRGVERSLLIVLLVPRAEILPAQPHLQRELGRHLPVVVDERRDRRRRVQGSRAAERAGAGRTVPEQEIGDVVPGELTVEREPATRRHFGELLVPPILRLQSEPDVVAAPHPARRVRHAEDVFRRALRDAAFAVAGEPGHREAGPAVVDRIGGAGKIAQADVADPVSAVEADRRVQVVGVVVAEPDLVDDVLRDDPRFAHCEVAAVLRKVREAEHARVDLRAFVVEKPLEQLVLRVERLIAPQRRGVRIVVERLNRHVVVHPARVRRGNGRRENPREVREASRRNDVSLEGLTCQRIDDRRRQAREVAAHERRIRHARKQRLVLIGSEPFVRAEEERAVLQRRPAERRTSLRAVARFLTEEVRRLVGGVAHVVVTGSAEAVRSRLRDDRDDGLTLSVLGGERVAEHVDFLHGVERRVQRDVVEAQRADVHAVDGVVGRAVAAAFDRHELTAAAAGGAELRAARERLRRDAGRQRRERQQVSAGNRQIFDLFLRDGLTHRRVRHLQEWRQSLNRHVLGDVRQRHRERRLRNLTVPHDEVFQLDCGEAGQLDAKDVGGRRQIRHGESPFGIGRHDALRVGAGIDHGHGGARKSGVRRIQHLTGDPAGGRFLCAYTGAQQQKRGSGQAHQPAEHKNPPSPIACCWDLVGSSLRSRQNNSTALSPFGTAKPTIQPDRSPNLHNQRH